MPRLTSRGLAVALCAVAALASGLVTGSGALVVLGVAAGALVVSAVAPLWLGGDTRAVGPHVELPPSPVLQQAAATVGLTFEITHTGAGGSLLVDDPAQAWGRGSGARKTTVGNGQSAGRSGRRPIVVRIGRLRRVPTGTGSLSTMAIAVPTGRRGLVVLGPCCLWRGDVLALWVRRIGATPPVPVLVCPSPIDVRGSDRSREVGGPDGAWSAPSAPATTDVATRRYQRAGDGDQWTGLSDYVQGDRLAAVHWPLSRRRGRLLAREMSSGAADQVMVVVDLSKNAVLADVDRLASAAAGVGVAALREGRSAAVGVWRGGGTLCVVVPETITALLSVLALVETMEGRWSAASTLSAEEVDGCVVVFARDGEVCTRRFLAPVVGGAREGAP